MGSYSSLIICLPSGKTRTFKPRKDVPEGTKQYQLRKYAEATLVGSHPRDDACIGSRATSDPLHTAVRDLGIYAWQYSFQRVKI